MFEFINDLIALMKSVLTNGVLLILLICVVIIVYNSKGKSNTTYYIDRSRSVDFANQCSNILRVSSINNTHKIKEVSDKNIADIEIYLMSRADMIAKRGKELEMYPGTNKPIYFSWTYQHPKPTIFIDETNWLYSVEESGLSVENYRTYVIQHEFMHALGYDHQVCDANTAPNGICPIMYQSTRGCPKGFKCGYNITKFDYEKKL